MTSIPPTGASSRVFTEATPLRRAVTAFSARGRLPFSTQDSCSTPVFSLEGRIKQSAKLISQRAIDEKQEELREGRDELCHLKKTIVHLESEFKQVVSSRENHAKNYLIFLKGIYSSLKDIQIGISRISADTLGKSPPSISSDNSLMRSEMYPISLHFETLNPDMKPAEVELHAEIEWYISKIIFLIPQLGSSIISLEYSIAPLIKKKQEAEKKLIDAQQHRLCIDDWASATCCVHERKVTLAEIKAMIASEERIIEQLKREAPSMINQEKALQLEYNRLFAMRDQLIIRGNVAVDKINAIIKRKKHMKGESIGPH